MSPSLQQSSTRIHSPSVFASSSSSSSSRMHPRRCYHRVHPEILRDSPPPKGARFDVQPTKPGRCPMGNTRWAHTPIRYAHTWQNKSRADTGMKCNAMTGTGTISTLFAKDLVASRDDLRTPVHHVVHGIATSSSVKREAFMQSTTYTQIESPKVYAKHEDLYADPHVDIVYVGLPHHLHKGACLAAMTAGKHVLCEKPMTINMQEFDEVVALAKEKGVFLMEGKALHVGTSCVFYGCCCF